MQFAWEAKRAKMKLSKDVYFAAAASRSRTPSIRGQNNCSRRAKIGQGHRVRNQGSVHGINADQELIAKFVKEHSDKFIGWCSVDPNDRDCVEQLEYYVNSLGLRGLKCSPIYQNWDPQDPKHLPLFKKAESLGIPVNIHQGTSFRPAGAAEVRETDPTRRHRDRLPESTDRDRSHGAPVGNRVHRADSQASESVREHFGSALPPWRHYQAFITAIEYGVEHKLIFGSDFPSATAAQVIAGQHKVNDIVAGTNFPKVSGEVIHNINIRELETVLAGVCVGQAFQPDLNGQTTSRDIRSA